MLPKHIISASLQVSTKPKLNDEPRLATLAQAQTKAANPKSRSLNHLRI
jgi:hypothetical protein